MKNKILKNDGHTFQCDICYEMERRGYKSEEKYFEDLFRDEVSNIKYKLTIQVDKKTFDSWRVCLEPKT